ncbi:hypothetical protein AB6A23_06085 [Paenibacillus tarimensis]
MKRWLGCILMAVTVVSLAGCGIAGSSLGAEEKGKFVLFVGKETDTDKIIMNRIKKQFGVEVTLMNDVEVNDQKAKPYSLVVVSQSTNPNQIRNKFLFSTVPVIYSQTQALSYVGMSAEDAESGAVKGQTVQMKDGKHPLAAGLKDSVDVYKEEGQMGYGTPGKEAIVIATLPGDDQKASIFAYEKGAINEFGKPAAAREVFYYLQSGEEINQTEEGWKLFDAAIRWAMEE